MKVPVRRTIDPGQFQPLRGREAARIPGAFGEGVADSLANLGGSISALGVALQEQEDKRKKFDALRQFSMFERDAKLSLEERIRGAEPGAQGIYQAQNQDFVEKQRQFVASLPQDLQQEFLARTTELGAGLGLSAMEAQYANNDNYYKMGIQDAFDAARVEVGQDGSRLSLEIQRSRLDEVIDQTGLPDAEKEAVRRKVYAGLEGVAYRSAQVKRLTEEAAGIGTETDQATNLLMDIGGLSEEEAVAKVREASQIAETAVGEDVWAALPKRSRAALLMAAATTGITKEVLTAVHSGDQEAIATALRESGAETAGDLIANPGAALDNDPAYSNVTYEDRLTLTADAEREVTAAHNATVAATKAQNQALVNSLFVAIYDGTAGQQDIDAMREKGVLTDYDDIKKAQDILDKRDETQNLRQLGEQMVAAGTTFAPGNEDHKKILNAMIGDEGIAALNKLDSDYAANRIIPIVSKTGSIPENVRETVSGMIRSPDAQKAYWAFDLMEQMQRASSRGFLDFAEADRKSLAFWQTHRDYLSEEDMVKAIRGPLDPAERNARAALRAEGEKLFTASDGTMKDYNPVQLFNQFFRGAQAPATKWAEQQLTDEFNQLFLDAYELSGNREASIKTAFTRMSEVWGLTNTGADNKLMKYPPEKVYPTSAGTHDWMEMQLRDEGLVLPDEQFELLADEQTAAEVGQSPPSYILVKIKNGVSSIPQDAKGLPIRVHFDFGAVQQADEQAWRDEQAKAVDDAAAQRIVTQGMEKMLEDGTTIPPELFDEYVGSGLLQQMMQTDPQAVKNGEAWDNAVNGKGPKAGFLTDGYRLK